MKKPKKLLYKKNAFEYYKKFFANLKPEEFFVYSESWTPQEIRMLAERHGAQVAYCHPKSEGYKLHGTMTMVMESWQCPNCKQWFESDHCLLCGFLHSDLAAE